jgi:alpha/beta superfamily hydrolase
MKSWIALALLILVPSLSATGLPETVSVGKFQLEWTGVTQEAGKDSVSVKLETSRGDIKANYYPATRENVRTRMGVVWVEGAGDGHGPAGPPETIYPAACEQLQKKGIANLHLHYRRPGFLVHCVLDALCGVAFLQSEGIDRVVLVGHSFGGAVVISAGAVSPVVRAIVPMSSQTEGTDFVGRVSPRKMLLIHGTADQVLPSSCSEEIYAEAGEPKELRLFKGAGHNLDESRQEIINLLVRWIPEELIR